MVQSFAVIKRDTLLHFRRIFIFTTVVGKFQLIYILAAMSSPLTSMYEAISHVLNHVFIFSTI